MAGLEVFSLAKDGSKWSMGKHPVEKMKNLKKVLDPPLRLGITLSSDSNQPLRKEGKQDVADRGIFQCLPGQREDAPPL